MKEIKREEFFKLDPLKKSQHPDSALSDLLVLISKIGTQKFLNGAGYNRERDLFISVLFAYAVRRWSRREWFIQQISDPPDFYILSPTNRAIKAKPIDRFGVEIVEVKSEHLEDAINVLRMTKLENYLPAPGTALLMFLNNKNAIRVGSQLSIWAAKNKEKFKNFSELYCLHLESFSPDTTWTYLLINILKPWSQRCILSDEFNKGVLFPHPLIENYQIRIVD